ncbi:MAG: hypothetical protein LAQ30_08875 [Acidobacteriia bacterium]|nr:hypothetical protein [Terriglobia bacterium]
MPQLDQFIEFVRAYELADGCDAPVSGGEPKAIEGTLAIMVGGPERTFDEVKEILAAMGASVTRVGEIGSGNIIQNHTSAGTETPSLADTVRVMAAASSE